MDGGRELDADDVALIEAATAIIDRAGDGSLHTVAAAIRDSADEIHGAVNVYHFTGGPCAELVALGVARTAGAHDLRTIVAVGDDGRGVLAPCGRDCQVLFDQHPGIRVIVPTDDGVRNLPVSELLPYSYRPTGRHR